jgi:hypothetical protein
MLNPKSILDLQKSCSKEANFYRYRHQFLTFLISEYLATVLTNEHNGFRNDGDEIYRTLIPLMNPRTHPPLQSFSEAHYTL